MFFFKRSKITCVVARQEPLDGAVAITRSVRNDRDDHVDVLGHDFSQLVDVRR